MYDTDDEFYEWVIDEEGNIKKIIKEQSPHSSQESNFTTYDTSHGHCGLCGSLYCNGSCFK